MTYEIKRFRRAGTVDEIPPMPGWGDLIAKQPPEKTDVKRRTCCTCKQKFDITEMTRCNTYWRCFSCVERVTQR